MKIAHTKSSYAEFSHIKPCCHAFMKSFVENSVESQSHVVPSSTADLAKHFHVDFLDETVGETFPDSFVPYKGTMMFGRIPLLFSAPFNLIA